MSTKETESYTGTVTELSVVSMLTLEKLRGYICLSVMVNFSTSGKPVISINDLIIRASAVTV